MKICCSVIIEDPNEEHMRIHTYVWYALFLCMLLQGPKEVDGKITNK